MRRSYDTRPALEASDVGPAADRRGVLEAEPPRARQVSGLLSAVVTLGDGSDGSDGSGGFGGLVSGVAARA
jgi:hypothetical protein